MVSGPQENNITITRVCEEGPIMVGSQGTVSGKRFLSKKVPLRLISTAGKREFKTSRNRYQLTFGRKAKKA